MKKANKKMAKTFKKAIIKTRKKLGLFYDEKSMFVFRKALVKRLSKKLKPKKFTVVCNGHNNNVFSMDSAQIRADLFSLGHHIHIIFDDLTKHSDIYINGKKG